MLLKRLILTGVVLMMPLPATAQEPDSVLIRVLKGHHLRITTGAEVSITGRALGVDAAAVRLVGTNVPLASIQVIAQRTRSGERVFTSGLVGAGVGALALTYLAARMGAGEGLNLIPVMGMGAGLGGLVGASAGASGATERWVTLWRSPNAPPPLSR
jgi:hypothetical protein